MSLIDQFSRQLRILIVFLLFFPILKKETENTLFFT
jgi:hypothetical protein